MADNGERRRKALLEAIDAATGSQPDIAKESGISETSIYFYRMELRRPSKEMVERVLRALEKRQRRLERALEKLRKAAD